MDLEKILKKNNLRITKERIEIFDFIQNYHLFSANDIIKNIKNIWRASIFRTLKTFLQIWIIRKISIWDNNDMYEYHKEWYHHEHITCNKCGKIESLEIENICDEIIIEAEKKWYEVKNHSVNITWTCLNCK